MKGAVAVGSGEGTPEVSESKMQVGGEGGEGSDGSDGGGESEGVNVDTDTLALYDVAAVIASRAEHPVPQQCLGHHVLAAVQRSRMMQTAIPHRSQAPDAGEAMMHS